MSVEKPTDLQAPLQRLLDIMVQLRDPDSGCPWDVKQSMQSLTRYTIEEAYEVADAIETGKPYSDIASELGDLLFQVVFYAQIAKEQGHFTFNDVCEAISNKLVRRHPHVFADGDRHVDLSAQWEAIKQSEKNNVQSNESVLDDVSRGLPALMYATKLQKKAASVGFDWSDVKDVRAKVAEELEEIDEAIDAHGIGHQRVEEEIGDALFALVNLSRHAKVDADTALRKASHKFASRFKMMEQRAREQQKELSGMTIEELEAYWQAVK